MKIERTQNARRGIVAGALLKVCQMILPFMMRTIMIRIMGAQYLGINSLFSSVLNILNLAELGVGAAMVFSAYEPIAKDDTATICALLRLYRRYYRIIGVVIGLLGLSLLPVLPTLVSGDIPSELNMYVLYLMNLGTTVLSYWLFAYKNCLLQAHQRNDIVSFVSIATMFVQYGTQFVILPVFRNYYLYLCVNLAIQILNNVIVALITRKIYPQYKPTGILSREFVKSINQKIRDLFTGKIGSVVVKSVDTIVISSFLGLRMLAIYQNYYFILSSVINIIEMVLSSIVAGLGNSFITESKEKNFADMEKFTFLLMWIVCVCICCFLGLYQPFMMLWVGESLMLEYGAVVSLAAYFFVYILNRLLNVYKDAAGLWHPDRFRPLTTAVVNLALNLWWVNRWGVYGVIWSTVLSILVIGIPWITNTLFSYFWGKDHIRSYMLQILSFAVMATASGCVVSLLCQQIHLDGFAALIVCGVISVTMPNVLLYLRYRKHRIFRPSIQFVDKLTKNKLRLEKLLFH